VTRFFNAFRPLLSDFLSTIAFVIIFSSTQNIVLAVCVGMVIGVGQIAYLRIRARPIDAMQWLSLALVIVLGGATLLTSDPRFVMVKPTIGGMAIATVMLRRGWMARYLPPIVTENVAPSVITGFGYAWSVTIFALAFANLAIALLMTPSFWAWFTAFVPLSVQLGLFGLQYVVIRRLVVRGLRTRTPHETVATS
jgi:intracellular septation protein